MSEESKREIGSTLLLLGRLALAAIFLFAAYAKLKPQVAMPWSPASIKTSLSMFAMQVDSYKLLSPSLVTLVANLLPPFELFLGLWLLSGIWLRFSSLITTLLLGGFFSVMVRSYRMGLEINCGCFGPGERLGPMTLLRDGSLLALALAVSIGAFMARRAKREKSAAPEAAVAVQQAN